MFNRPLVLVAIDHATDVERVMEVALSAAMARAAVVRVIQVVPHVAVRFDDGPDRWTLGPHDSVDNRRRLA